MRYYLRKAYGNCLAEGSQLLTANYSYAAIAEMPTGAITPKMRQAFAAYGALPRLHSIQDPSADGEEIDDAQRRAEGQSARTPTRSKQVAYYATRTTDNWERGILPTNHHTLPAGARGWRLPSEAEQIDDALMPKRPSKWTIVLSASPRAALLHAQQIADDANALPLEIIAIDLLQTEGSVVDLSDKGGRARHRLKKQKEQRAEELKAILLLGDSSRPPRVPAHATLAHLSVAELPASAIAPREKHELRMKAIPAGTACALADLTTRAHAEANAECDPTAAREATGVPRDVKLTWRRVEVTRQLLMHNPYYCPTARLGGRSTSADEHRAIRWARVGVARIADVVHEDGDRLSSLQARWSICLDVLA